MNAVESFNATYYMNPSTTPELERTVLVRDLCERKHGVFRGSDAYRVAGVGGNLVSASPWRTMAAVYWFMIGFVEVRMVGFTQRAGREEEVGNWKGIINELKRDREGKKDEARWFRKDLEWRVERNL